jgi:lipoprotein-anchoring transpeptidase ErfK/SrfK
MPRTLLLSRLALIVAAVVGANWLSAAHAQSDNERQQMLFGGAPRAKNYNFFGFGGTDATRTKVSYSGRETPGTIVVNTAERRLYLVQDGGSALRYSIGVGRVGFQWKGTHKVSAKKEWPGWTPPPEMRARQRGLPVHMAGGEGNPLGARAMYLGSTLYRIHGSNDPDSIGQAESSGCFRMTNDDVKDLYERVAIGTTVIVR